MPEEAVYADDADFIAEEETRKQALLENMTEVLGRANLKVNETKTEQTTLERKNKGICYKIAEKKDDDMKLKLVKEVETWRTVKKLGSLLGVTEDINRRKQLAMAALNKMYG